jgi:hypothetical protein
VLRESYGGHAHDERMVGSLNMMQRAYDVLATTTKLLKV